MQTHTPYRVALEFNNIISHVHNYGTEIFNINNPSSRTLITTVGYQQREGGRRLPIIDVISGTLKLATVISQLCPDRHKSPVWGDTHQYPHFRSGFHKQTRRITTREWPRSCVGTD